MGRRRKQIKKCADFPKINKKNHTVTSDQDRAYNCIAFAAGETHRKWWPASHPDAYWPIALPQPDTPDAFIKAFQTLGYAVCADDSYDPALQKIVFYVVFGHVKHAAIQLGPNKWASKLGDCEDIQHKKIAISEGSYGVPTVYMARRKAS